MKGNSDFVADFKEQAIFRLKENVPRIETCLKALNENQIWKKPNTETNSIGNLILHLCGNIRQYAISSLGKKTDLRDRDAEFASSPSLSKIKLLEKLKTTVDEAVFTINVLTHANLLMVRPVQCYEMSGTGIIIHVVEHFSYHTGQIALLTKLELEADLGFYQDDKLTAKNS